MYIQNSQQEEKRRRIFTCGNYKIRNNDKKLFKQVVGIDIAHKEIDIYLGNMDQEAATHLDADKTFKNNEMGFGALILWVKKHT